MLVDNVMDDGAESSLLRIRSPAEASENQLGTTRWVYRCAHSNSVRTESRDSSGSKLPASTGFRRKCRFESELWTVGVSPESAFRPMPTSTGPAHFGLQKLGNCS
ncbi:hypothetical protein ACJRO7_024533 [Eucalyptus globulus]|uniref:Uncharacterized protein n=1 Tax=Eucalyptus globulus TaxID=34317 RepID=A0ABD3K6U5_EUCGL